MSSFEIKQQDIKFKKEVSKSGGFKKWIKKQTNIFKRRINK